MTIDGLDSGNERLYSISRLLVVQYTGHMSRPVVSPAVRQPCTKLNIMNSIADFPFSVI
jgi:hypothetical protein